MGGVRIPMANLAKYQQSKLGLGSRLGGPPPSNSD